MSLKLVIFDCDGTLVDSQHTICEAMARAFVTVGFEPPTSAETRSIIGLSLPQAISQLRADAPRDKVVEAYKKEFFRMRQDPAFAQPALYPGIKDLLDRLRQADNVLMAIATGKSRRGLLALVQHYGWDGYFNSLHTADDGPSKPHPHMVESALDQAGTTPDQAVMIGDTLFDMQMASAAGMTGIGVSWGYHSPELMREGGASLICDQTEALESFLFRWIGGQHE